jgi:hypothetical protein
MAKGDTWKHRQYKSHGLSEIPRNYTSRELKFHIFDDCLLYLSNDGLDMQTYADRHGLRREDINSLLFVLMGMRGVHFRKAFHQVQMVDELPRYTDLDMADVPKRAGFGSANNLYQTHNREFDIAPGERHQKIRKEGDVWR